MKKKIIVLMVAKNFLVGHRREGEPTNFKESILKGIKKHTIRGISTKWDKAREDLEAGRAVLSIRQWTGKPYRSPQVEIARSEHATIQERFILDSECDVYAKNDGLMLDDFNSWFKGSRNEHGHIGRVNVIYFNIDRRTKEQRRRYHLHNMIRYKYRVNARQKEVRLMRTVKPNDKDVKVLRELIKKGYNVQYSI